MQRRSTKTRQAWIFFQVFFLSLFASLSVMTLSASIYTVNYARRMRKYSQFHSYKERAFMDLLLLCWGFRFLKSFQEKKNKSQQLFIYGTLVKKTALISVNGNGYAMSLQSESRFKNSHIKSQNQHSNIIFDHVSRNILIFPVFCSLTFAKDWKLMIRPLSVTWATAVVLNGSRIV